MIDRRHRVETWPDRNRPFIVRWTRHHADGGLSAEVHTNLNEAARAAHLDEAADIGLVELVEAIDPDGTRVVYDRNAVLGMVDPPPDPSAAGPHPYYLMLAPPPEIDPDGIDADGLGGFEDIPTAQAVGGGWRRFGDRVYVRDRTGAKVAPGVRP